MPEKQNIEWKATWRDEYLKWICGFANAQGGRIYIGIDDKGVISPLKNSKKLLEDIPNKIRQTLGIIADVNLHSTADGEYIEIFVDPQPYPISYYGEYHYRSGSTKQQLTGQQLNQFLLKKTGISWDSVPVTGISPEKLRVDAFDIFREKAVKSKRMSSENVDMDNMQLLDSLNLLDDGNIKRAGILLFHHDPEKWIPGSYVKIGYFSSDADIVYQDEIHGSLLKQADSVIDLIFTKYLKGIISYEGITRVENYPYPREAIREAVLNAIAHKNYAALIPIQIRVYDDKIIISNDCILPDGWTAETLLGQHKSVPYNPLIANTFYRAGLIESWGRGIEKINNACINAGNEIPEYIIHPGDISAIFTAKATAQIPQDIPQATQDFPKVPQASSDEIDTAIIDCIRIIPSASSSKISKETGLNHEVVKYHLKKLKNKNIIRREGSSQKGKWVIIEE